MISIPEPNGAGKRQSQLKPVQIEAICFPGFVTKISNHNTQITNNIKITNSNTRRKRLRCA